jgi:uncharacterized 2Fe-2S/4Fe-4S cluster protein (DUF4445 family)
MGLIREIDYGTKAIQSETMVTLTIDGQSVTVPEGTSIMRAAMEIGTQIPKLCASDMLDSFGSCRVCLIEIEGRNGTGFLHHAGRQGHGGAYAKRPAVPAAARGDGALRVRSSARLVF